MYFCKRNLSFIVVTYTSKAEWDQLLLESKGSSDGAHQLSLFLHRLLACLQKGFQPTLVSLMFIFTFF